MRIDGMTNLKTMVIMDELVGIVEENKRKAINGADRVVLGLEYAPELLEKFP